MMATKENDEPKELGQLLNGAAKSRAAQMLERTHEYVLHETPTGDHDALDSFLDGVAVVHERLGGTVRRLRVSGCPHLVSDFPGSSKSADDRAVLLVGHADTVWPIGQLSVMPWQVSDGTAAGPGSYDMKSGLVVMETAMAILRDLSVPHRPVRIVITSDEEIGSPTSQALVRECAVGVIAALGFESPHLDGALKTGRWGSTRLRVTVRGREAHAALDPGNGVSAIDELIDQLLSIRKLVADESPSGSQGVLCNVGTISGGGRTNVIPREATAEIGLRFLDLDSEIRLLERLGQLAPVRKGAEVSVTTLSSRPCWNPLPKTSPLWTSVSAAAALVDQRIKGRPAAGAADTNRLGADGIPTLDGFGASGAGAHAVNEHIIIDSLTKRAALLAAVLSTL
jgi:glutamate carboxypeptidase